jgi:hypothetical protein
MEGKGVGRRNGGACVAEGAVPPARRRPRASSRASKRVSQQGSREERGPGRRRKTRQSLEQPFVPRSFPPKPLTPPPPSHPLPGPPSQALAQRLAGSRFNIQAPTDVSDVLFSRLKLPPPPGVKTLR